MDESKQRLFWTSNHDGAPGGGSVWTSDQDGSHPYMIYGEPDASIGDAKGIVIDEKRGWLYFGAQGKIIKLKLNADHRGIVSAQSGALFDHLVFVAGMAYDSDSDRLYWASPAGGYVMTARPSDAEPTTLYKFSDADPNGDDPNPGPIGIVLDSSTEMLYWTRHSECNCVQRAPSSGSGVPVTLFQTGTKRVFGVALSSPVL